MVHRIANQLRTYSHKKRFLALDTAKGFAVLLMVFTHTINLVTPNFHSLEIYKYFGDTVSVTTFITFFGSSLFFGFFTQPLTKQLLLKAFRMMITYYVGYIILVLSLHGFQTQFSYEYSTVLSFLLLQRILHFSEFFIPFIIFIPLIAIFRLSTISIKKFPRISFLIFPIFGLGLYVVGTGLYSGIGYSIFGNFWSVPFHLFGCDGCITFPVFQYALPLSIGLSLGCLIFYINDKLVTTFRIPIYILICFSIFVVFLTEPYTILQTVSYQRWPPTLSFLSVGILFSLFILGVSLVIPKILQYLLSIYGNFSLQITIGHILFLFFMDYIQVEKVESIGMVLVYFLMSLHIPLAIYLLGVFKLRLLKGSETSIIQVTS